MGIRPDHRPRRWLRPPPSLRPLPPLHLRRRAGTLVAAAAAVTLAVPTLAACAAAPASSFSSPASSAHLRAPAAGPKPAIRARQLPPGIFGVLYDPEAWTFTPAAEQQNPVQAATAAAAVAHAHGMRFIVAPAIDLTNVLSSSGTGPRWRQF